MMIQTKLFENRTIIKYLPILLKYWGGKDPCRCK